MLQELLEKRNMTLKALSLQSGIPYATLCDLKNGKKQIDDCSVRVLKALSDALGMEMGDLYQNLAYYDKRNFANFRRNALLELKEVGPEKFLIDCIATDRIERLAKKNRLQAYYTVAMVDYLCEINQIPLADRFEAIRQTDFGNQVPGGVDKLIDWRDGHEG